MNKKETKIKTKQELEIKWQAPEFEYREKDVSWYWISLIIGIVLIALAIWQRNFLFIVFVVIAWFTIINLARNKPIIWDFKISENGIKIALPEGKGSEKKYSFNDFKGFDIHDNQGENNLSGKEKYKELILKFKSKFSPFLKIKIPIDEAEKIESFLKERLSKEEYEESLADSLSKLIGF